MNTVVLDVTVPSDAKVVVNDLPTTSTGEHRRYISRDLQPGRVYRYQVRAEFMRDGKATIDEQTVELTAGDTRSITLGGAPGPKVADIGTAATTLVLAKRLGSSERLPISSTTLSESARLARPPDEMAGEGYWPSASRKHV